MYTGAKKLRFILFDILFNLFNIYLIYYFQGKGIKPDLNDSEKSFNFSIQSGLYPPHFVYDIQRKMLFMYNLCMNRASLDCVSWTSTTRYEVELSFKENHPVIHDHFTVCKKRLCNTFTCLELNLEILKQYDNIFKQ